MIDEKIVRHVAKLARIKLTDEQVVKFSGQLAKVFEQIAVLQEVDTEGVVETSQVTGLTNVYRKDEVSFQDGDRTELLDCSQLPIDSRQIRVLRTIK